MSSDEKKKANRENSKRSTGPTSPEGKDRSARNAVKSGLFSQSLVIVSAGERQEDFDALLSKLRDSPRKVLFDEFVKDLAENLWLRRRVRRYQTSEIRRQCDTAPLRRRLDRISEVDSLKSRFIRDLAALCATGPGPDKRAALDLSIEKTRRQLENTSLGLNFLYKQIEVLHKQVECDGWLTPQGEVFLVAACGVEDKAVGDCLAINQFAKAEGEKLKNGEEADKTTFEETKVVLSVWFLSKMMSLASREKSIRSLESVEEEAYLACLVMPPADVLERIHRVEAALTRSLFKTLDVLSDIA